MSRQELAEEIKAYLFRKTNREYAIDANYIGKLERGEHRWPNANYRKAFRAVLRAATDAELGFFVIRGRGQWPPGPEPAGPDRPMSSPAGAGIVPPTGGNGCRSGAGRPTPIGTRPGVAALDTAVAQDATHARQFASAVADSFVDAIVVDQVVAELRRLARSYGAGPLPELFTEIRALRMKVCNLIEHNRHPGQLRYLHLLGSRLSGLSGHVALDRHDLAVADIHARAAWLCANLAGHGGMRAWVRALQSVTAFFDGRLSEAVTALREAAQLSAGPCPADDIGGVFTVPVTWLSVAAGAGAGGDTVVRQR